jgi:hypothetical protein
MAPVTAPMAAENPLMEVGQLMLSRVTITRNWMCTISTYGGRARRVGQHLMILLYKPHHAKHS